MFKGVVVKFGLLVTCIILVLTGSLLLVTRTGFQEMSESVETITETMLQKDILHKNLRDREAAEAYGNAVTQYFSWIAAPHLWNFNYASLQEAAEGVLEVPHVVYGALYDETGKIQGASQELSVPEEEIRTFQQNILYQGTSIGSAEIGVNISYLQDLQRENEVVKENLIASFRHQTGEIQKNIIRNNVVVALAIALGASLGLLFLALELQRRSHQAQKQIQESEEKFRRIFNTAPYGMGLCSLENGAILEGNPALEKIFGHSLRDMGGETLLHLGIIPEDEDFECSLNLLRCQQPLSNVPQAILHASGEARQVLYSLVSLQAEKNLGLLIVADMTEHHHLSQSNKTLMKEIENHTRSLRRLDDMLKKRQIMMEKIQSQLHLLNKSFEHIGEGIFMADQDQRILTTNPAFTTVTGYSFKEVEGETLEFFSNSLQPREIYETMYRQLKKRHFWEGELWQLRKEGDIYPLLLTITALTDQQGTILHYIGVLQDRSEIHQSRVELEYETLHDNLTKLPNRRLFLDRLAVACKQAEEQRSHIAVMLIGLDRFDTINRSLGYAVGDDLLRETARRFEKILPEEGHLARFGGDAFVFLLPFGRDLRDPLAIAERMIRAVREPFVWESEEIHVTASGGISVYPQDASTPEELLKNASLALGRAKEENRDWFQLYTLDMNEEMQARYALENELRRGIQEKEFIMYYQPKLTATPGTICGMEALMRWIRPGKGIIPPDIFIPLAEEMGEIVRLGELALVTASEQIKQWNRNLGKRFPMAVNVSSRQFNDEDFSSSILRSIEKAGIDPVLLELEITESVFMNDLQRAKTIMEDLNKEGIRFSLDDFGTGYSSLSYIQHLPLGGIKVDRSLTADVHYNPSTQAVMSTLAFMARELGVELTIEGVETEEQLQFIQSLGKDLMVQGYLFSPPLPPEEFFRYLQKHSS